MPAPGPKGALFPTAYRAGAAVTACRMVKRGADADSVIHNAAATTPSLGITEEDQATVGKPVRVAHRPGELVRVEAGAATALDAFLTSDATGRAVTAATGNQVTAIGRQVAAAAGDLILCEIRYQLAP
jgi:hypothetical protein